MNATASNILVILIIAISAIGLSWRIYRSASKTSCDGCPYHSTGKDTNASCRDCTHKKKLITPITLPAYKKSEKRQQILVSYLKI